MNNKGILVKCVEGIWGVELRDMLDDAKDSFIKMKSKEDAFLYARVCESNTGCKVLVME